MILLRINWPSCVPENISLQKISESKYLAWPQVNFWTPGTRVPDRPIKNKPVSLLCQNDSDSDDDDDDDGGANTEWRDYYNRIICNRKHGQNKQHVVPITETVEVPKRNLAGMRGNIDPAGRSIAILGHMATFCDKMRKCSLPLGASGNF